MSERLTANAVRQSMAATALTTEEVVAYEKQITDAADFGNTKTVLHCVRKVKNWAQSNPHMEQVAAHFARQGFVCRFDPGHEKPMDGGFLATVFVSWALPERGREGEK